MSEFDEAPSLSPKDNANTMVQSWLMEIGC
jgi:hypothetical protein